MTLPTTSPVAPLGRRFLAFFLDGFVLVPIYAVYGIALDGLFGALVEAGPNGTGLVVVAIDPARVAIELTLTLLTDAAYYAGSWAWWGMTIGQRACRVAVRAVGPGATPPTGRPAAPPDPSRVPAQAAVVRWAILQVLPLCVGTLGAAGAIPLEVIGLLNGTWFGLLVVTVLADPLRRGLHDRAADTVVMPAPVVRQR